MIRKAAYLFLSVLMVIHFSAQAQDVSVTASLDSSAITIGQQAKLTLRVHYRADNGRHIHVTWPEINDTIRKEIEVVSHGREDTVISKTDPFDISISRTIYITSFDSGYWAIPPFSFRINNDSGSVQTEPLLLQVNTIAVDTTAAIRNIKGIYEEEYTWLDWLKDNKYVIWIGLAALVLIGLLIWYLTRPKPEIIIQEEIKPVIPAHILALEKLEKLKNEKLWQEGKLKQYHSGISDIVREYLENRFRVSALEQTTDEILFGIRNLAIDEESKASLRQVLVLADLVKFAKEQPLPDENEQSLLQAVKFINGTKREEEYKAESK